MTPRQQRLTRRSRRATGKPLPKSPAAPKQQFSSPKHTITLKDVVSAVSVKPIVGSRRKKGPTGSHAVSPSLQLSPGTSEFEFTYSSSSSSNAMGDHAVSKLQDFNADCSTPTVFRESPQSRQPISPLSERQPVPNTSPMKKPYIGTTYISPASRGSAQAISEAMTPSGQQQRQSGEPAQAAPSIATLQQQQFTEAPPEKLLSGSAAVLHALLLALVVAVVLVKALGLPTNLDGPFAYFR